MRAFAYVYVQNLTFHISKATFCVWGVPVGQGCSKGDKKEGPASEKSLILEPLFDVFAGIFCTCF